MERVYQIEMDQTIQGFQFTSSLLKDYEKESDQIDESLKTLQELKPQCDQMDYVLAACSGVLCGMIDVYLVDIPKNSKLGVSVDGWFEKATINYAKKQGCPKEKCDTLHQAIAWLENLNKVPYDHTYVDPTDPLYGKVKLCANDHHFKGLAHNPTIAGLIFSIYDQVNNQGTFVDRGTQFVLKSKNNNQMIDKPISRIIYDGFFTWVNHLISDHAGSSNSKNRGAGIPSPFLCWINSITSICHQAQIDVPEFLKTMNHVCDKVYEEGFDVRFQVCQSIPVVLNELIIRSFYAIRRLLSYQANHSLKECSFQELIKVCIPSNQISLQRMLLVGHSCFCAVDLMDASFTAMLGVDPAFQAKQFMLRINFTGLNAFCFYAGLEIKRQVNVHQTKAQLQQDIEHHNQTRVLIEEYLRGVKQLSSFYQDEMFDQFVLDFSNSDLCVHAFESSIVVAVNRHVKEDDILKSKEEIDAYFGGKR